ncbi:MULTISPECIES: LysE family translocator [Pseudomonas]|uniref:Putative transport-related LysE family membrane protein n=1 Tax=Pseudomonas brassicacearum (strain NFM421) TaxID=994484 RepID=F2KHP3_PSEBN|nr:MULTISPECIES: LysE family translocator [Pseudomonas]VVM78293.1 Threonine efflux protein [Pseudomonas fluorescens]AEA69329.1 putative transport-related LysE family membrane protein [Pseudomonas brassicacearum subsp. brassicacearum NFM421]PJH89567.1 LysE family translocator [Pseudomonas sp. WCS365]ROM92949.1 amino acid transporter [Pseudomonas brassicacearum]RON07006.1 amino acid transporter [Pseudomonas brassicacearum]
MSFDFHHLLLVFTAYIVGAASPGPSNMRIMGVAMHQGRKPALMLAAGVISGSFFWGSMAATGVSAILLQFTQALFVLKIVGGAYLLFLALKAGRSALTPDEQIEKALAAAPTVSGFGLYRRGLLMHLTNPKALLGWIATMTLGLGPQATPETVVIILAGCAVLSITIFCGYAIVFSTAPMIRGYRRARGWIEGTLALVFGAAGFRLLFSRT